MFGFAACVKDARGEREEGYITRRASEIFIAADGHATFELAMDNMRQAIETFVATAAEPAVLEPGEPMILLRKDHYALAQRGQRLTLEAWDDERNLVRRVVRIERQTRGRMTLAVEKFARREGTLDLIDRARAANFELQRKSARSIFRERMRLFLAREFAGWKIVELTCEADLEHSLSPAFPRAFLRRGGCGWAAIGSGPECEDVAASLSFGLIWLEYLRRREHKVAIEGLVLIVPAGQERAVSLRLPFLNHAAAKFRLFSYSEEDVAVRIDPADYGNVHTVLEPCRHAISPNAGAVDFTHLNQIPGFEAVERPDGSASLRVNGWEIGRITDTPSEAQRREIEAMAAGIAEIRSDAGRHTGNPLYRNQPEAWLEAMVRSHLPVIDPSLRARPLYGQAPTFMGGNRSVMDLLACDGGGRLAILEIKASADLHLPLQALDYWLRVKWHLDRGEFTAQGYFPGIELRSEPPRLLLVAPALEFHPTSESILRYFAPTIEVERIGVNARWRRELQIMFRTRGCEPPAGNTWKEW